MAEIDVCIVPQQLVPVGIQTEQQQISMGGCSCGGGINPAYWGRIYGDIKTQKDLMELISSGVGGKEVQQVLTVGDTAPADPQDGDYYINTGSESLLLYVEQYEQWQNVQPSEDNIYIAIDTSHIWLWNGTQFVDVTGTESGGIIYINNIDTGLNNVTSKGLYTVCYTEGSTAQYYTLTVNRINGRSIYGRPRIDKYIQTLWNYNEVRNRQKMSNQDWPAWTIREYVFDADLEEVRRLAKKALKIAKAAL